MRARLRRPPRQVARALYIGDMRHLIASLTAGTIAVVALLALGACAATPPEPQNHRVVVERPEPTAEPSPGPTDPARPTEPGQLVPDCVAYRTQIDAQTFPANWAGKVRAEDLPPKEREPAATIINLALSKYPAPLLCRNLRTVHVLQSLQNKGVLIGGTSSRDAVYISFQRMYPLLALGDPRGMQTTETQCERSFHHEFSSILLRNYASVFPRDRWLAVNPPGFRYSEEAARADALWGRPSDRPDGLFSPYCRSNLENDFNVVCAELFISDTLIWETAAKYERINAKVQLAIEFLAAVDPTFSESYFRGFAQPAK